MTAFILRKTMLSFAAPIGNASYADKAAYWARYWYLQAPPQKITARHLHWTRLITSSFALLILHNHFLSNIVRNVKRPLVFFFKTIKNAGVLSKLSSCSDSCWSFQSNYQALLLVNPGYKILVQINAIINLQTFYSNQLATSILAQFRQHPVFLRNLRKSRLLGHFLRFWAMWNNHDIQGRFLTLNY